MSSWSLPIHNDSLLAPKSAITIGKSNLSKGGKKLWVKNAVVFQMYANKICMYVPKNFTFLPIIDHCECIALGTHDYWSRRDALIPDRPVNINIAVKFCSDDSSNKNKKKHYNLINT